MKFKSLAVIALSIFMPLQVQAATYQQKNKIDFNDVDKNVATWKYFLNSQEVNFLPEIEIEGGTKFLPVEIVKSLGAVLIFDQAEKTAYISNNDETFVLREGSKQIYLSNKTYTLSDAPIWRNNTLYVPTNFLIKLGILISENKFRNELSVIKSFNSINDLTTNFDNLESKITFNLNSMPVYDVDRGKDYYRLTFFGTMPRETDKLKKQLAGFTSDFKKIDLDTLTPGITNVTFYPKTNLDMANIYYLDKPGRLVVQFPKLYKDETREKFSSSLYRMKLAEGNYFGPNKINILEINPRKDLVLKPVIAKDANGYTIREIGKLSKDFNAVAGINGGYFSGKTRLPLGLVYINNELISAPLYNRSALFFNKDGTFEIKNIDLNIFLKFTDLSGSNKLLKINAYNQAPQKNQIVLFNYNYAKNNLKPKTSKNSSDDTKDDNDEYVGYFISNKGDKPFKLTDIGQDLPMNNMVLYASGKGKEDLEKNVDTMTNYELQFNYTESLNNAVNALGGGPTLVKDGGVNITAQAEKFKPDITDGKAPRTSLGLLQNGNILIVTVDGRLEGSKGMTLEEMAYFLKTHDTKDAINFDGGGSTTMYFNGETINETSDPTERKVSNGLLIFQKK